MAFEHNVSIEDAIPFRLASSTSTTLSKNIVTDARIGIRLIGANEDLDIIDNNFHVRLDPLNPLLPSGGVARASNPPAPPNPEALIKGNTIIGSGAGAGIGIGANGLRNSQILDNTVRGMGAQGIALLAGNTGNTVSGNIVTNNGGDGIQAGVGATGNRFEANTMHDNAGVDARDLNTPFPLNVWHANACETDFPVGAICGIP